MGKQAATKVRAGAKGTGAAEEIFSAAPTLRLVSSPKRQRILEYLLSVITPPLAHGDIATQGSQITKKGHQALNLGMPQSGPIR